MSFAYKLLQGNPGLEKGTSYTPVHDKNNDDESEFLITPLRSDSRWTLPQLARTCGVFFLGVICTASLFIIRDSIIGRATYETGFSEEKILPRTALQLEQRRFTSPVDFRVEDGVEFLVTSPGATAYVGATNDQIDRAWEELLWGRYFSISESEARSLWGSKYHMYYDRDNTGYTGGFDMFHQLHCLNQIRQALHRDYYPETPIHGPVHLNHCIDHLRQAIQCWGSTAITPIKWFEGYHHGYVQSDQVHTCRKFEPIREYVSQRFNGSLAVPRQRGNVDEDDNAF